MAPTKLFVTGITGYVGGTFVDLLLNKPETVSLYKIRALVRSPEKAEKDIRPLGVEPVIGSLDDVELLKKEAAQADVVLNFADADHLGAAKAILEGLAQRPRPEGGRARPILIQTSGTGVLLDRANGNFASEEIYYDNDVAQLSTLSADQPHRNVDLEIIAPRWKGVVDTYVVLPPTIWGFGTGPGNRNSIQIPLQVQVSLKHQQALQIGKGLNIWGKVHVIDLAHFYILLLDRALQEPQGDSIIPEIAGGGSGANLQEDERVPLPKNDDAYYFVEDGEFAYGEVAEEVARVFKNLGINDSGEVNATDEEEQGAYWPPIAGFLLGGNSRSSAVKAREILNWEPQYKDFQEYIAEEVDRQRAAEGQN